MNNLKFGVYNVLSRSHSISITIYTIHVMNFISEYCNHSLTYFLETICWLSNLKFHYNHIKIGYIFLWKIQISLLKSSSWWTFSISSSCSTGDGVWWCFLFFDRSLWLILELPSPPPFRYIVLMESIPAIASRVDGDVLPPLQQQTFLCYLHNDFIL